MSDQDEQRVIVVAVTDGEVRARPVPTGSVVAIPHDDGCIDPYPVAVGEVRTLLLGDEPVLIDDPERLPNAISCRVIRGQRVDGQLYLVLRPEASQGSGDDISVPGTAVGYDEDDIPVELREAPFLVAEDQGRPVGVCDHDGGVGGFLEGLRTARSEDLRESQRQAKRQRERRDSDNYFINPYTFVPFPDAVPPKTALAGHHVLRKDRFSGWVTVRWTARTPLLLRGARGFPRRADGQEGERLMLPGSGIKGAVRSLHETLAGGCLRVLQRDFTPVYRETMAPREGDWRLAKVVSADGDEVKVVVSEGETGVAWASATDLHRVVGNGALETGTEVVIKETPTKNPARGKRYEIGGTMIGLPADGQPDRWTVLVTHSGARKPRSSYWAALGKFTPESAELEVDLEVAQRYHREVAGSDDVRLRAGSTRPGGMAPDLSVMYPHPNGGYIGERREATACLQMGDVLWAQVEQQGQNLAVTRLSRAVIWRREGQGSLGERVPKALHPCDSPDNLCVSCRLFGSVATEGQGDEESGAVQTGYRGHVRFGDAVAAGPLETTLDHIRLPRTGAPRPGAGQFYLRPRRLGDTKAVAGREQRPIREWGAAEDDGERPDLRQLRGRKYYWHADPSSQQPPRHNLEGGERVEVAQPETEFIGRVWFDNLDRSELGGLLAALAPQCPLKGLAPPGYADEPHIASRIGGGKPLGLGTVDVELEGLRLDTARSRYLGEAPPDVDVDELIKEFVLATPLGVRAIWPHLAAVLDTGHVHPGYVSYPPAHRWSVHGGQPYEPGFKFWQASAGGAPTKEQLEPIEGRFRGLKDPDWPDQSHRIVPKG